MTRREVITQLSTITGFSGHPLLTHLQLDTAPTLISDLVEDLSGVPIDDLRAALESLENQQHNND